MFFSWRSIWMLSSWIWIWVIVHPVSLAILLSSHTAVVLVQAESRGWVYSIQLNGDASCHSTWHFGQKSSIWNSAFDDKVKLHESINHEEVCESETQNSNSFDSFLFSRLSKLNRIMRFSSMKLNSSYTTHNIHMNSYRTTEWASNHSMIEFKFVYGWWS